MNLMQDISLGVALGSATQIAMFVVRRYTYTCIIVLKFDNRINIYMPYIINFCISQVPLCVIVAWIMGINMDLNFNLLETGSLALAIVATAFTLQVK